jgi:hypothetical protein
VATTTSPAITGVLTIAWLPIEAVHAGRPRATSMAVNVADSSTT